MGDVTPGCPLQTPSMPLAVKVETPTPFLFSAAAFSPKTNIKCGDMFHGDRNYGPLLVGKAIFIKIADTSCCHLSTAATSQLVPHVNCCHLSTGATCQLLPLVNCCHLSTVATCQLLPLVSCCYLINSSQIDAISQATQ